MSQLDSIWIDLRTRFHEVLIQEHHRPYASFQECCYPYAQDPQMIKFIGDKSITLLMKSLFSIESQDNHNKVHLRLVPDTIKAQSPTFIADCELHNITNFRKAIVGVVPGIIDQRSIRWLRNTPRGFDPNSSANLQNNSEFRYQQASRKSFKELILSLKFLYLGLKNRDLVTFLVPNSPSV
jgi:hypothetical protein